MADFKKILVCLDLTEMDALLIKYTSFLAKKMEADKICFLHAMHTYDLPQDASEMFPDLDKPLDELIREEMQQHIDQEFDKNIGCEVETVVEEGHPSDVVIQYANHQDIDLIVLGKKVSYRGQGILSGKIIRMAHCSTLVLPENMRFQTKKILVPLDFSNHARMALEQAFMIAEQYNANVICQNVFSLPTHYYPYMPGENTEHTMREHAEKEYRKFIDQMGGQFAALPCEFTMDEDRDVSQKIYDYALKEEADLIVVGSRGRTKAASFLLGSIAEKLMDFDKNIPLMIVKNKKESLGLAEALVKWFKKD